jgi:hypothetical protein
MTKYGLFDNEYGLFSLYTLSKNFPEENKKYRTAYKYLMDIIIIDLIR